jgi:uncharacterized membrane protein
MQLYSLERWAVRHKDFRIIALFYEDTARVLKFMVCRVDPVGLVAVTHSSTQYSWRERTLFTGGYYVLVQLGRFMGAAVCKVGSRLHNSKMEFQASSSVCSSSQTFKRRQLSLTFIMSVLITLFIFLLSIPSFINNICHGFIKSLNLICQNKACTSSTFTNIC